MQLRNIKLQIRPSTPLKQKQQQMKRLLCTEEMPDKRVRTQGDAALEVNICSAMPANSMWMQVMEFDLDIFERVAPALYSSLLLD